MRNFHLYPKPITWVRAIRVSIVYAYFGQVGPEFHASQRFSHCISFGDCIWSILQSSLPAAPPSTGEGYVLQKRALHSISYIETSFCATWCINQSPKEESRQKQSKQKHPSTTERCPNPIRRLKRRLHFILQTGAHPLFVLGIGPLSSFFFRFRTVGARPVG